MPDSVTVEVKGLQELLKRFGDSNKIVNSEIKRAMDKSVKHLKRLVKVYPPPIPPGHWAAHTTPAQKRAFFAQMREGGWTGRTDALKRSITTEVRGMGGEIRGIVGANMPYDIYVIGPKQAAFHKGRWKTMVQHAKEQADKIEEFFVKATESIAKRLAG